MLSTVSIRRYCERQPALALDQTICTGSGVDNGNAKCIGCSEEGRRGDGSLLLLVVVELKEDVQVYGATDTLRGQASGGVPTQTTTLTKQQL